MLRIPDCLGNGLLDGGKVVSLTYRPRSAPTLRSWVRIPLRHGCLCVFCVHYIESELKLLVKA
jgi:hypothetical protein